MKISRDNLFVALVVFLAFMFICSTGLFLLNLVKVSFDTIGTTIENGVYEILTDDGRENAIVWEDIDGALKYVNQYSVISDASGEYTVRNVYTNTVLTAIVDSKNGTLGFEFLPHNGKCQQKWLVLDAADSENSLVSTCDINLHSPLWVFRAVEKQLVLPSPEAQIIDDGVFALVPTMSVLSMVDTVSKPLRLQITEKTNSLGQLFEIAHNGRGFYTIFNLDSEVYLDITTDGDLSFNEAKREYCGQDWSIKETGGRYKIVSTCTGDILGAQDGVNVGLVEPVEDQHALWQLSERKPILFIGDSITYGRTNCNYDTSRCRTAAINAVDVELEILNSVESMYIEINMGNPGVTAFGYLSKMDEKYEQMVKQYRIGIAQVMLGTNDASQGYLASSYADNISGIVDKLKNLGVGAIILNRPIYNVGNAIRLNEYLKELANMADGEMVFLGDVDASDWFKDHLEHLDGGGNGFHPDDYGYNMLGQFWATAFMLTVEK